jgi:integrase
MSATIRPTARPWVPERIRPWWLWIVPALAFPPAGFIGHEVVGFNWWWRRARDAAALECSIRFHDLRHAFASALISAGCSVKAVQRALGHASASTTLDTYGHLWPGDEDRIRQAVDAVHALRAEDSLRTAGPHR